MGRPQSYSRDEFLDAAQLIIDEEGLEALTVRRLGAAVGVSYTAFYTYFESLDDVVGGLLERVNSEAVSAVMPSDASVRERLVTIALAVRAALTRHPRLLPAYIRWTGRLERGEQATLAVIGLLEEAGLRGRDLLMAYRSLENFVFGVSVFDHGAAPDHLAIRRRRYESSGHPVFESIIDSDETIAAHNDEAFREGFERLLSAFGI